MAVFLFILAVYQVGRMVIRYTDRRVLKIIYESSSSQQVRKQQPRGGVVHQKV